MTSRLSFLGATAALLLLGVLATAGTASAKPRQTLDMRFTSERPGAPTGAKVNPTWLGDHPGEKAHTITEDRFTFAKGAKLDFSVPTKCTATDKRLTNAGPAVCPKSSRVGEGGVGLDIGRSVAGLPRVIRTHVAMLSGGPHQIITVFRVTNLKLGFPLRVIDRGAVHGRTMSAENQLIPGFPPPDEYTAVKFDRLNFKRIVRGHGKNRRSFLTTPPRCPASGSWINTATFEYVDHVTQNASSQSPCEG